jgi:hypothetical protein
MPLSIPELKYLLLGEWLANGFSMYTETFDYTAPLSAWTYQFLDFVFGRSRTAHWILSTLLVFFQAMRFNRSLLKNKVFSESNYVPAFLYVVFATSTFDFFALSPQLLSLTWVVISMDHLIRKMDNEAGDELFLFPGFYLGVAALFYFPAVSFFIVFLLALIIITRAQPRRIFLFIFGYATVFLLIMILLYFTGALTDFWEVYFIEAYREKIFYFGYGVLGIWLIFPALFFLIALITAIGRREGSLHAKTQQFMILVLLASLSVVLLSGTLSGSDLLFFIPVFTFFLSNYILKIRKRFWRFFIPNLLVVSALLVPHFGLKIKQLTDGLVVAKGVVDPEFTNKKIMIIGPLQPLYLSGEIAGPFIDERISQTRLEELDYYHTAPLFLNIFRKSNPDIIVDAWGQMQKIERRFPEIADKQYKVSVP